MDFKRRLGLLLAGTVLGTSILVSAPAFADDVQLQQQINTMQRQLQAMQDQLAETKKQAKAAAQQAQQTQQAQQLEGQSAATNKRRTSRPTFRRISTPRMCRSRPKGRPRGSTASTSRWPARSSRWKVRSASAMKLRRALAIRPSARFRCKTRRSMAKTSCASVPNRAASRSRPRAISTRPGTSRATSKRTFWAPA